jgi:hypothetical protein
VSITGIEPSFGTDAGGTTVLLTGAFGPNTTVELGGVPATVLSSTPTTLEVLTPAMPWTGQVDVEVHEGAQRDVLEDGFQYWADATGQTAATGAVATLEMVGGYWVDPVDIAWASVAMTQPGSRWHVWQAYAPAMNTCAFDYTYPEPTPLQTSATSMTFSSPSGPGFTLLPDPSSPGWFSETSLLLGVEAVPGATYDLMPLPGSVDWPSFTQPSAVTLPDPFSIQSPYVYGISMDSVDRTFSVTWTGGSAGDHVLLYLTRQWYDATTDQWYDDGVVTCAADDTGAVTIPGSVWPDWYAGDVVLLELGRVVEDGGVMPHNNGHNDIAGINWVLGAVQTR